MLLLFPSCCCCCPLDVAVAALLLLSLSCRCPLVAVTVLILLLFPSCCCHCTNIYQLYPYHLQDMLIKGLRVTPFSYYSTMMAAIMVSEKSYDSLPNFTAADCEFGCHGDDHMTDSCHVGLRLMGIGRNQYIDLMNQYRSKVIRNYLWQSQVENELC